MARGAAIPCRGAEYSQPGKAEPVSMRTMGHTVSAYRGSSFSPNGAFAAYSELGEPVYSLRVRRRDVEKFQALRDFLRA